jgi:hypothetical protein
MVPNSVVGAIELASQVKTSMANVDKAKAFVNGRSLIDIASVARVEPIMMVDADIMNTEVLPDALQASHSMFAGYYLQAVNMVNAVGGVTVAERLAPFNPNAGSAFEELCLDAKRSTSMEEFKFKLPLRADPAPVVSMESDKSDEYAFNTIRDASNLSVGKIFNVSLSGDVMIPVAIRLLVNSIPSRVMVDLFSNTDAFDQDFKERFHAWKSGRIAFWKDLVLCNDLIDKRVKTSISDPSGVLNTIRQRQSGNNVNAALTGKASVANATNLALLSSETADAIEGAMGGPLKNSKIRRAVFDSTNLMIVGVVNKHWERVTFYFRGLDSTTTLSYKELKTIGKGDGSNVTDILKAYISGASPTL